jgi:hypothetical protein
MLIKEFVRRRQIKHKKIKGKIVYLETGKNIRYE